MVVASVRSPGAPPARWSPLPRAPRGGSCAATDLLRLLSSRSPRASCAKLGLAESHRTGAGEDRVVVSEVEEDVGVIPGPITVGPTSAGSAEATMRTKRVGVDLSSSLADLAATLYLCWFRVPAITTIRANIRSARVCCLIGQLGRRFSRTAQRRRPGRCLFRAVGLRL